MSLHALRKGHHVRIGPSEFVILQPLTECSWQLQNIATGEWCTFNEDELLDRFAKNELSFVVGVEGSHPSCRPTRRKAHARPFNLSTRAGCSGQKSGEVSERDRPAAANFDYAENHRTAHPSRVSERIKDIKPPGWRTVCRDYRKWIAAGRDIRAIILRHAERGKQGTRLVPEVKAMSDQVIQELYMTTERKRVPEVHLEIVRRLTDANKFRPEDDQLPIPSRSTIYREIARLSPYEVIMARYGKRRAEMEFRVSTSGPVTTRALERVVMDHTPSDLIVVDDNTMLPLGRPTITTALDEHTRCPMGFYAGFEPPSCLAVMRCLKHAILPKTYLPRQFPSVKNRWECYGVPELVVVDNPPEFHSTPLRAGVLADWLRHSVREGSRALVQGEDRAIPGHHESRSDARQPRNHVQQYLGTRRLRSRQARCRPAQHLS